MKKILFIILSILMFTGCSKEKKKEKNEIIVKKTILTERKEYYVSKVNYINHDDYFEFLREKNESKNTIQKLENDIPKDSSYMTNNEEVVNTSINNEDEEQNGNNVVVEEEIKTAFEGENDLIIQETEEVFLEQVVIKTGLSGTNLSTENNITAEENKIELEEIKSGYYAPNGTYLGETKVKVIDVSYYQGNINWDVFAKESDCYGVILRLGYYETLDKKFERNINELKKLNIPYGIYLFSYATTLNGSNKEAEFTSNMIDKFELNPTLGIYYDIESWVSSNGASSNDISKEEYDIIISNYANKVSNHIGGKYKVKVYSGRWYAMNRLGDVAKSYVDWVAEYDSTLKYDSSYTMWQYTSKGSVPGINGNVDISYLY